MAMTVTYSVVPRKNPAKKDEIGRASCRERV